MRHSILALPSAVCLLGMTTISQATVRVSIDLTRQRMHITSAQGSYDWPISSARSGFYTPGGSFAPTHLELMHYSRKYHMSPMPHAIFFRGGYAIHGSYETGSLGRPASHGCVRLSPGNAATLYGMVRAEGARISISGTPPATRTYIARSRRGPTTAGDYAYGAGGAEKGYGDVPYANGRVYQRAYGNYGVAPGLGYGYQYGYGYAPQQFYGYGSGY